MTVQLAGRTDVEAYFGKSDLRHCSELNFPFQLTHAKLE